MWLCNTYSKEGKDGLLILSPLPSICKAGTESLCRRETAGRRACTSLQKQVSGLSREKQQPSEKPSLLPAISPLEIHPPLPHFACERQTCDWASCVCHYKSTSGLGIIAKNTQKTVFGSSLLLRLTFTSNISISFPSQSNINCISGIGNCIVRSGLNITLILVMLQLRENRPPLLRLMMNL